MAGFLARFNYARERVVDAKGNAARKAVVELFQRVVNESPFDTGRFRGNWQITSNRPAEGVLNRDDPTGAQAVNDMVEHMRTIPKPLEMEVWFVNNLPYAEALEYGSSAQAPNGMLRVNVNKFPKILAKWIKKEGGL